MIADKNAGDELSMHIATATVLHRVFTFDKSLSLTVSSGLISATLMAAFITWHCIADELIMHSVLFGTYRFPYSLPIPCLPLSHHPTSTNQEQE
jgi:hypothetical protein